VRLDVDLTDTERQNELENQEEDLLERIILIKTTQSD